MKFSVLSIASVGVIVALHAAPANAQFIGKSTKRGTSSPTSDTLTSAKSAKAAALFTKPAKASVSTSSPTRDKLGSTSSPTSDTLGSKSSKGVFGKSSKGSKSAVTNNKLCPPGKEVQIPIASVLHYSDDECSTLDTRESYRGFYTNPDANPDTPEANYTYFCDPEKLKLGEYAKFGVTRLSSCYFNNGGNLYAHPVGMCSSFFIPPGGPPSLSVIISSINHTTWEVTTEVYLGPDCQGEPIDGGTYPNNECLKSNVAGSYQFVVPNAVNIACSD